MPNTTPNNTPQKPGFWRVTLSTIAAAFGVQSRKNHEEDIKQGNIYHYLLAGILFTLLFITAIVFVVRIVLSSVSSGS